jgi:hypothetical protein
MTEFQIRDLEAKEAEGTITRKEQKRLNASRNQGRTSEGYKGRKLRRRLERSEE